MKILILASNPRKDLDLDSEIRIIKTAIHDSRGRDRIDVIHEPGVLVGDLQRLLLRYRPEVVHFCGHGSGREGLIFKHQNGGEQWLQTEALASFFGLKQIREQVKCVVLNACYAEDQANAIVNHIDYVVGASHAIQDQAAIVFSKGFYLSLGEGCSFEDAFEFGKNAIQLEISGVSSKMRSATAQQRKAEVLGATGAVIPEHWKLVLKRRTDLTQAGSGLSQAQREAIQIHIAELLIRDANDSKAPIQERFSGQPEFKAQREQAKQSFKPVASQAKNLPLQVFEFQTPELTIVQRHGHSNLEIIYQLGRAECLIENLENNICLEMVKIPSGFFIMGSTEDRSEQPQRLIMLPSFLMGKFAVTQAQWKAVAVLPKVKQALEVDPARFKGNNRPVERVSWYDAVEFCARLSRKTGRDYRLPSEAEWEYACRAGTKTPFYCGETITTDLANYDGNYIYGAGTKGTHRRRTTAVGKFSPNAFGLCDMHGNVREWCLDHWHDSYQDAPENGDAWLSENKNTYRLLRGGSWYYNPRDCRSTSRDSYLPDYGDRDIGFRVVCSVSRSAILG